LRTEAGPERAGTALGVTALSQLPGEHDGPPTVSYPTRCGVGRHPGVVVVVGVDPDLGTTPVPHLVNEVPSTVMSACMGPDFRGNPYISTATRAAKLPYIAAM
jgi:hypothetical protein